MYFESKYRSIVKTISWRILATLTTVALVYIFIGDTTIAFTVGGIEVFLKMLVYFVHERVWDKIKFGKREINPAVIWLTGLAKSGKKETGLELQKLLIKKGYKTEFIDGHSIRDIFPSTGFKEEEVNMHIKRVGYLAKKLEDQGIFVIASFLSPYKESRSFVRNMCSNFHEIHIATPLESCIKRDDSGIYSLYEEGKIKNLPGKDVEYQIPHSPEVVVNIDEISPAQAAEKIYDSVSKTI